MRNFITPIKSNYKDMEEFYVNYNYYKFNYTMYNIDENKLKLVYQKDYPTYYVKIYFYGVVGRYIYIAVIKDKRNNKCWRQPFYISTGFNHPNRSKKGHAWPFNMFYYNEEIIKDNIKNDPGWLGKYYHDPYVGRDIYHNKDINKLPNILRVIKEKVEESFSNRNYYV